MSAKSFPFLNGDLGVSLGIPSGGPGVVLGSPRGFLGGSRGHPRGSWGVLGRPQGILGRSGGLGFNRLGGPWRLRGGSWERQGGPWEVLRRSSGGLQGVLEESQGRKRLKKRRKQSTTEHKHLEIYSQLMLFMTLSVPSLGQVQSPMGAPAAFLGSVFCGF